MGIGGRGPALAGFGVDLLVTVQVGPLQELVGQGHGLAQGALHLGPERGGQHLLYQVPQLRRPVFHILSADLDVVPVADHVRCGVVSAGCKIRVRVGSLNVAQVIAVEQQAVAVAWIRNQAVAVPVLVVGALIPNQHVENSLGLTAHPGLVAGLIGGQHGLGGVVHQSAVLDQALDEGRTVGCLAECHQHVTNVEQPVRRKCECVGEIAGGVGARVRIGLQRDLDGIV